MQGLHPNKTFLSINSLVREKAAAMRSMTIYLAQGAFKKFGKNAKTQR